jgi:hypothetical protein
MGLREYRRLILAGDSALTGLPRMAEVEVSDVRDSDRSIPTQMVALYALADGLRQPARVFPGPRCLPFPIWMPVDRHAAE